MATKAKQKLTPAQQQYQALAKKNEPRRPLVRNCIIAFLVGGLICTIGQAITEFFVRYYGFTEVKAASPTVAVMVFIAVVLTSIGVYDKIAQWAGAGTAVPVTGFANSMCSAALEYRSEGLVLGVGSMMFKLAGSVIVFGTVAAFFVALAHVIVDAVRGG
ncbi:stage V sporulation protein AC [Paenibacillus xerothermodurans]|uniref:Stage V sporulation protein AC n=1 Tax=Paenibacillus xerothermodurans TaxID=1977292 RepID=A0A2W1NYG6_PAEXE|nr:stage V sporulation protein AC [Paenibacillus xerothermodurans]PZE22766.1 stage V sporulation protein AC [Paenibacillus xerothermodurans]